MLFPDGSICFVAFRYSLWYPDCGIVRIWTLCLVADQLRKYLYNPIYFFKGCITLINVMICSIYRPIVPPPEKFTHSSTSQTMFCVTRVFQLQSKFWPCGISHPTGLSTTMPKMFFRILVRLFDPGNEMSDGRMSGFETENHFRKMYVTHSNTSWKFASQCYSVLRSAFRRRIQLSQAFYRSSSTRSVFIKRSRKVCLHTAGIPKYRSAKYNNINYNFPT